MMDDALVGVPIGLPAAVDCACMDLPVLPRRLCHAFVDKDVCQSNLTTENSVHSLKLGVHASRILERAGGVACGRCLADYYCPGGLLPARSVPCPDNSKSDPGMISSSPETLGV